MAAETGPDSPRSAVGIAAVLASMTLVVLDASLANLALPTLSRALGATPGRSILVVIAYQAALVMSLLPCGALGERFGYRRIFAGGLVAFVSASLCCALAPSLAWLVAARFLQGLGGAAVLALGVPLLGLSVPRERLGAAISWNALTVALASAAGPSLGALILTRASWPWLFALNLPLGGAALLAAHALPESAGRTRAVDPISMALNALMFGALILAAELLPASPGLAAALIFPVVLSLAALLRRETAKTAPLIPFDLLRQGSFKMSVIASVCCFTGQTAGLVALPFYLQQGLGQDLAATGLYMTAWPLAVAATALAAGRLSDRFSTALLCILGAACLAAGLAAMALWPLAGGPWPIIPFVALCGLGFGLFQTPNNRNMFLAAPPERSGAAGGMQGTARLTGQTAGAVLVTLLFAAAPIEAAARAAFGIGAVLTLAAGAVSALRVAPRSATRGSV